MLIRLSPLLDAQVTNLVLNSKSRQLNVVTNISVNPFKVHPIIKIFGMATMCLECNPFFIYQRLHPDMSRYQVNSLPPNCKYIIIYLNGKHGSVI